MNREQELALQKEYIENNPDYIKAGKVVPFKPHKKKKINLKNNKKLGLHNTLKQFKKVLIQKITPHEKLFKKMLIDLNIKFEFRKIFIANRKDYTIGNKKGYIVAFYLKNYGMVVEVRKHITQTAEDLIRTDDLLKINSINQIILYSNQEIDDMNTQDMAKELLVKICPFAESLIT